MAAVRRSGILIWLLVIVGVDANAITAAAAIRGIPDPALKDWPNWPGKVRCGVLSLKPQVAFSQPTGAERGDRPSEVALREALADGTFASMEPHMHGWSLLAETPRYAEFGNGRFGGRLETIGVAHRRKGWRATGYTGGCEAAVIHAGREAVTWRLASGRHPTPTTTTIGVIPTGGECGPPVDERLKPPAFREENGALLMSLWERPFHGASFCPSFFEKPVEIRLPEPLGHRRLLDSSVFPPLSPYPHR